MSWNGFGTVVKLGKCEGRTASGQQKTRSENQAKLPTSARTKTAVVQWFSAAGAGTITTIRYPAQLRAISCTFLPTAVLQKLGYHYTAAQLVDRMETGDACSGLSLNTLCLPSTRLTTSSRGVCSAVLWRDD